MLHVRPPETLRDYLLYVPTWIAGQLLYLGGRFVVAVFCGMDKVFPRKPKE